MLTDALIKKISDDATPVKPKRVEVFMALWFLFGGVFAGFFLWQVGIVPDLNLKLQQWDYVLALVLLIGAYVFSTVLSLRSAEPGSLPTGPRKDYILGAMILTSLALYGGLLTGNAIFSAPVMEALGCCMRISFGALLPNLAAAVIASRLAPVDTRRIVKYSMTSSMLLISIVSQLNCPVTDFAHIMTGHGVFLVISAVLTYFIYLSVFNLTANSALRRNLGELSGLLKAKIG